MTYRVYFGGELIGEFNATSVAALIERFGLEACGDISAAKRCPTERGLHAHIPAGMFSGEPVMRGEQAFFVANIPELGEIAYAFGPGRVVPPPITFARRI
ncbi:hypothetical protein C4552_01345 [Candidatus Parcubacteria bacterium]|nr:MAG: hypothetical protein C4552_01345 [Candidatus Parcubacteria bacterium]